MSMRALLAMRQGGKELLQSRCTVPLFTQPSHFILFHSTVGTALHASKVDLEGSLQSKKHLENDAVKSNNQSTPLRKKTKPQVKGKTYRADRVLSNRGWGSRSECFEILKQRRVVQKFDKDTFPVLGPSEKISMHADLWIDNEIQVPLPPPLLRVYHKPKWVLSVMSDSKGRPNLSDLDFVHKMHPVGRLDYDTSGLLLFSSDGSLTQKLLHPSGGIQKEYVALVTGTVNEDELRTKLAEGVQTAMGTFPANLVYAKPIPAEDVRPTTEGLLRNLPPEYDMDKLEENGYLFFKDATELSEVRVIVEEGKHRMVRKILANSGFPVIGLKRERLGAILLDDLEPGRYRELNEKELAWVQSLLKKKSVENSLE